MRILNKILFVLSIVIGLSACTAPIDIITEDAEPRLSIFGYITNSQKVHTIKISSTTGYFSSERPPVVSGAIVTISYDNVVARLYENSDTLGVYMTDEYFRGEEGKTYTLNIALDYNNDGVMEDYQAVATMPYSTRVDSVKLDSSTNTWFPNLLLYGYVPDIQKNNLALYLIKNNEEINILDYFMIIPDWYFKGNEIEGYEFPCVVGNGIAIGDTIAFRVSSFSEDFAEFISNASSEAGGSNPLFGGPPADVKSNVTALDPANNTPIAGYFGAFPSDEKFTISDREYFSGYFSN